MDRKWSLYRNFVVLQFLDGLTTWWILNRKDGYEEGNLLMAHAGLGWWGLLALKLAVTAMIGWMVWYQKDDYKGQKIAFTVSVVMLAVVAWNVSIIFR